MCQTILFGVNRLDALMLAANSWNTSGSSTCFTCTAHTRMSTTRCVINENAYDEDNMCREGGKKMSMSSYAAVHESLHWKQRAMCILMDSFHSLH